VGTNADKHARQKVGRNARLAEAREQMVAQSRRRKAVSAVGVVIGVAILVGGFLALTKDDSSPSATGSTTTTTPGEAALPAPPEGITLTKATPCPPAAGSAKRVVKFDSAPPTCIDPNATYTATFSTNKGEFTAQLDPKRAPISVNNFVVLSRYHFYDGVAFHRIVPGFVIQTGDGDGDPWGENDLGYTIPDELPRSSADYKDYSLAMANAGPDTNGSQFFVVLPGGGQQLDPPNYSLFGQVTQGQDVVDAIGKLGNAQQKPTEAVVVDKVTITETK